MGDEVGLGVAFKLRPVYVQRPLDRRLEDTAWHSLAPVGQWFGHADVQQNQFAGRVRGHVASSSQYPGTWGRTARCRAFAPRSQAGHTMECALEALPDEPLIFVSFLFGGP